MNRRNKSIINPYNNYITSLNISIPKKRKLLHTSLTQQTLLNHHHHQSKSSSSSNLDPLDGFAIKTHHMSIADHLYQSMNSLNNTKTNIIFNQPFPLITVISKRNVLNNSPSLVKSVLRCKRRQYQLRDQNLLLTKHNSNNNNHITSLPEGYSINIKRNNKTNESVLGNKKDINKSSLAYQHEIEYKNKCKIKDYLHLHDCNVFNKTYFNKTPFDNYARNAYKAKCLYENNYFTSKIKKDVSKLKFSNSLKAYSEIYPQ